MDEWVVDCAFDRLRERVTRGCSTAVTGNSAAPAGCARTGSTLNWSGSETPWLSVAITCTIEPSAGVGMDAMVV